jgi:hypothetical protein
MSTAASLNAGTLAATPLWFPHLLDPATDRVLLVEKNEAEYRDAAFLDERSLKPDGARHGVEWWHLAAAFGPAARRDVQYIFHIGHVGSTLVSRLLGELAGVLARRGGGPVGPGVYPRPARRADGPSLAHLPAGAEGPGQGDQLR